MPVSVGRYSSIKRTPSARASIASSTHLLIYWRSLLYRTLSHPFHLAATAATAAHAPEKQESKKRGKEKKKKKEKGEQRRGTQRRKRKKKTPSSGSVTPALRAPLVFARVVLYRTEEENEKQRKRKSNCKRWRQQLAQSVNRSVGRSSVVCLVWKKKTRWKRERPCQRLALL
ncbi:hypothetical protein BKA80DRAFT_71264 [Phyllosticta citrichinensis]